jgi:tRNA threonylcarbamoyladenosine dehydratase
MEQFLRIQRFLGEERFQRLRSRRVVVVGLGAVGGYVLEGLARAGINEFRLVDFDTIQPTNINRQILALTDTLGRPKVEVGRERVLAINPDCRVEALQLFAGSDTMERILSPRPDLLVDAIDSLNPKVQLLTEGYRRGIPIISSMGAALRTDPAQIRCADLFDTKKCPLARRLRARLRRNEVDRGILCVYSTEDVDFAYNDPEKEPQLGEIPFESRGRQRRILGSLPTLTGIFGLIIANQAILQLAEKDPCHDEK